MPRFRDGSTEESSLMDSIRKGFDSTVQTGEEYFNVSKNAFQEILNPRQAWENLKQSAEYIGDKISDLGSSIQENLGGLKDDIGQNKYGDIPDDSLFPPATANKGREEQFSNGIGNLSEQLPFDPIIKTEIIDTGNAILVIEYYESGKTTKQLIPYSKGSPVLGIPYYLGGKTVIVYDAFSELKNVSRFAFSLLEYKSRYENHKRIYFYSENGSYYSHSIQLGIDYTVVETHSTGEFSQGEFIQSPTNSQFYFITWEQLQDLQVEYFVLQNTNIYNDNFLERKKRKIAIFNDDGSIYSEGSLVPIVPLPIEPNMNSDDCCKNIHKLIRKELERQKPLIVQSASAAAPAAILSIPEIAAALQWVGAAAKAIPVNGISLALSALWSLYKTGQLAVATYDWIVASQNAAQAKESAARAELLLQKALQNQSNETALNNLIIKINNIDKSAIFLSQKVEAIKGNVNALTKELTKLSNVPLQMFNLTQALNLLNIKVFNLSNIVSNTNTVVNSLSSSLSRLYSETSKLSTGIGNYVNNSIRSLKSETNLKLNGMQSTINNLKTQVDTKIQNIVNDKINATIPNVVTQVQNIVSPTITNLQKAVNAVQTVPVIPQSILNQISAAMTQGTIALSISRNLQKENTMNNTLLEKIFNALGTVSNDLETTKSFSASAARSAGIAAANTSASALESAASEAMCNQVNHLNSCFNQQFGTPVKQGLNRNTNLLNKLSGQLGQNFGNIVSGIGATLDAIILPIVKSTNAIVKRTEPIINATNVAINTVSTTVNKISTNLGKLGESLGLDKAINFLNFMMNVHILFQLSSSAFTTVTYLVNNIANLFGIKGADGNPIDVNALLGNKINQMLAAIIGQNNVDGLSDTFKASSRIYQASWGVVSSVTNVVDSLRIVVELVGERVSIIGNAMKKYGLVSEKAYSWFNEQWDKMTTQNQNWLRMQQRVTDFDSAVSGVDALIGSGTSLVNSVNEVKTSREEQQAAFKAFEALDQSENKEPRPDSLTEKTESDNEKASASSPVTEFDTDEIK